MMKEKKKYSFVLSYAMGTNMLKSDVSSKIIEQNEQYNNSILDDTVSQVPKL